MRLSGQLDAAVRIAGILYERGQTAGAAGNISFRFGGQIYISAGGTCFGLIGREDFAVLGSDGEHIDGPCPSKEWPLHVSFYNKHPAIGSVIHAHSPYAVLWSCLMQAPGRPIIPRYTPYLKQRLGTVEYVPYAPPGSMQLFDLFEQHQNQAEGYLLSNHGTIAGGVDIYDAFYRIEELEESCRIAWMLEGGGMTKNIIKED